jgi:beta-fructofuranosidase
MLLAARRPSGPSRHRGCIALAAGTDLQTWEVRDPFWAPDEWFTHECPDCFRIGDWWYVVFSTFSDRSVTHYRMARSLAGPWLCPPNNTFDSRAFYAAKTAGDDNERFVFGWLPTRAGDRDEGGWQWGGNLVAHRVIQQPDGSLSVRAPETVLAAFDRPVALEPRPVLGNWDIAGGTFHAPAVGRFSAVTLGHMPQECLLEADVTFGEWTCGCGLLLRVGEGAETYYQVRLEPANQRVVTDRWPRAGDQPVMLERPLRMLPGQPVHLRAIADGTCLVVYADDVVALSCRMYDLPDGDWGLFATEGDVQFSGVYLRVRG